MLKQAAKNIGKSIARAAIFYATGTMLVSGAIFTNAQRFISNKKNLADMTQAARSAEKSPDPDLYKFANDCKLINSPQDSLSLNDYSYGYSDEPAPGDQKVNLENYTKVDLRENEISIVDALEKAKKEGKDSILFVSGDLEGNRVEYQTISKEKLSDIYAHNKESQEKLGLNGIEIIVENDAPHLAYSKALPFEVACSPHLFNKLREATNVIFDHETAHLAEAAKSPLSNFKSNWVNTVNYVGQFMGVRMSDPAEDHADYIAGKLDPNNAKAVLYEFAPIRRGGNYTRERFESSLGAMAIMDQRSGPDAHSSKIVRIKNFVKAAR